jgi:hypothetical protein
VKCPKYAFPFCAFFWWWQNYLSMLGKKAQTPNQSNKSCHLLFEPSLKSACLTENWCVLRGNVTTTIRCWLPKTRTQSTHSFLIHNVTVTVQFDYMWYRHSDLRQDFLSCKQGLEYITKRWPTWRTVLTSNSPFHCPQSLKCPLVLHP